MSAPPAQLDAALHAVDAAVLPIAGFRVIADVAARWRQDAAAASFHLRRKSNACPLIAILGGTGTGKSTLVNRLVGSPPAPPVTAASLRRTFTAGCVAVAADPSQQLPADWLGIPHAIAAADVPARGEPQSLTVLARDMPLTRIVVLIDTPDLDGDHPAHHAQADRAFRWATHVVFLVTPEKYQMTELLPYYRLAARYGLPAAFVMNKCERAEVFDDYRRQLGGWGWADANAFAVARDDAAFEPAAADNLAALVHDLTRLAENNAPAGGAGFRCADLASRAYDQLLAPLRQARSAADALVEILRAIDAPLPGVNVHPIAAALERRLQERSVLYLMGPQRVLDRARQVPTLLTRLPRAAWDFVLSGQPIQSGLLKDANADRAVPDFKALLVDQLTILRSRLDDAVRGSAATAAWVDADAVGYAAVPLPNESAAAIADDEIAKLNAWLNAHRNKDPRDTRALRRLLKLLPGGEKLAAWTESAPYLLAAWLVVSHALLGMDLVVLGGYSLITWLTERVSNEVTARTRAANNAIITRFEKLAHEQVQRAIAWAQAQTPAAKQLDVLASAIDRLGDASAA